MNFKAGSVFTSGFFVYVKTFFILFQITQFWETKIPGFLVTITVRFDLISQNFLRWILYWLLKNHLS